MAEAAARQGGNWFVAGACLATVVAAPVAMTIVYVIGRIAFGFFFSNTLFDRVVFISLATAFETVSIWLVLYFGFFEESAPESVEWHFLILLAVAVATQIVLLLVFDRVSENYSNTLSQNADRTAKINLSEIARTQQPFNATVAAASQDYLTHIKAMGFPTVLSPEHLAAGGGLARTRALVIQARALIQKEAAADHGAAETYRQQVVSSRMDSGMKDEQLTQFAETHNGYDDFRQQMWTLQDKIFGEYQAELADLSRGREYWMPRGKGILFADKDDLAIFNRHMTAINAYTAEERQVELQIPGLPSAARTLPKTNLAPLRPGFVPPQRLQ